MKLTDKELEIMNLLWESESPLTATEIIEASEDRTWKEGSIYAIMNTLIKKGAVVLKCHKPTGSNTARAYETIITSEEYLVSNIGSVIESGVRVDIPTFIKCIKNNLKG